MITIGTRKSKLAMWQTEKVATTLQENGQDTKINSIDTIGDKILDTTIAKIGSKGVFTVELEDQLAGGITDIAVHSAKDMQSQLPDEFTLIAFTEREKVHDVLVSNNSLINIDDTSKPLVIGTSSVRRRALMRHFYPHVKLVEMRGNLQTRIQKMSDGACDAIMLAYAGVKRMGYEDLIVKEFSVDTFVPPVGQGCIAIEAAKILDTEKKEKVRSCLNNAESEICLLAERAFLRTMEGGCSIPAFGYATLLGDEITLTGGLASLDGKTILKSTQKGKKISPEELGERVGNDILNQGGKEILAAIALEQQE